MPQSKTGVELLTVPEFLTLARISRSTFYLLLRSNRGPPVVRLAGRTFIERAAGEAWIRMQQTGTPPPARPTTGGPALSKTSMILRALAPHKNLSIAFELADGPRLLADVCRLTGLDEGAVRHVLPAMRSAITARRDAEGRVVLALASPAVAGLVEAARRVHDEN